MVGANSPSSLASRPIRILLADEIDRYPATAATRGDPLLLPESVLRRFGKRSLRFDPYQQETSRIAVEFEHSTQEEWNVPCPACGRHSRPYCGRTSYLTGTSWTKSAVPARPAALFPAKRSGKNSTSTENSLRPTGTKGSGLRNALASLFVGGGKSLKSSDRKRKKREEKQHRTSVREKYQNCEVPEEVLVLTAGVDVQDDRFEAGSRRLGVDKRKVGASRYQVIYGDGSQSPYGTNWTAFFLNVHNGRRKTIPKIIARASIPADTSRRTGLPFLQGSGQPATCL